MKLKIVSKRHNFKVLLIAFIAVIFLQRPPASYAEISQLEQAPWQEIWTLNEVKTTMVTTSDKVRQTENALEVLSQALQTAQAIMDTGTKAWVLTSIAGKFAQVGQTDKALEILSQVLQTANTITDTGTKAWVLTGIAVKFAQVGQYEDALLIANTISLRNAKERALQNIDEALLSRAVKFAQAGQYEDALRIVNRITGSKLKTEALRSIYGALQTDKDLELLLQALQTAQTITDTGWRTKALSGIALKFAQAGQYEDAFRIVNRISYHSTKENALQNINEALLSRAESYAKAGQTDNALEEFAQGFQTANTITDTRTRAQTLNRIAQSFAKVVQMSLNLSVEKKAPEPLNVKAAEPLDVKATEPLEEDKLYGIYQEVIVSHRLIFSIF